MRFFIKHPNLRNYPKTYLATDSLTGASSLTVKNTDEFSTTNFAIIGKLGQETTEIIRPTTITAPGTLGSLATATQFPHNADTLVTMSEFDNIKIYRSTDGINGAYTLLSTIPISVNDDVTFFNDTSGTPTYYYKITYFNSNTSAESDQSDAFAGTGFVYYSLKSLCERVLSLYGDTKEEQIKSDDVAIWINEFYELAQTHLAVASKRFNIKSFTLTTETGVTDYPIPATDFLVEAAARYSNDFGVTFPRENSLVMGQLDSMGHTTERPSYVIFNDTISFDGLPDGKIVKVWYISMTTTLTSQTDVLPSPFSNKSYMFVDYALGKCYLKDKKFIEYQDLRDSAMKSLDEHVKFIKQITSRHPQNVEIVGNYY